MRTVCHTIISLSRGKAACKDTVKIIWVSPFWPWKDCDLNSRLSNSSTTPSHCRLKLTVLNKTLVKFNSNQTRLTQETDILPHCAKLPASHLCPQNGKSGPGEAVVFLSLSSSPCLAASLRQPEQTKNSSIRTSGAAQQVKAFALKSNKVSSTPKTHMVERTDPSRCPLTSICAL